MTGSNFQPTGSRTSHPDACIFLFVHAPSITSNIYSISDVTDMLGQVQTKLFSMPKSYTNAILSSLQAVPINGIRYLWLIIDTSLSKNFKTIKVELFKLKFLEFQQLSNMYAKYASCYAFIIVPNGLGWECVILNNFGKYQ